MHANLAKSISNKPIYLKMTFSRLLKVKKLLIKSISIPVAMKCTCNFEILQIVSEIECL